MGALCCSRRAASSATRVCASDRNRVLIEQLQGLGKVLEALIDIDVIYHYCSTRTQHWPSMINFKAYIVCTMHTIVDEEVNLGRVGQERREPVFTRAPDVGPRCENRLPTAIPVCCCR